MLAESLQVVDDVSGLAVNVRAVDEAALLKRVEDLDSSRGEVSIKDLLPLGDPDLLILTQVVDAIDDHDAARGCQLLLPSVEIQDLISLTGVPLLQEAKRDKHRCCLGYERMPGSMTIVELEIR